MSVNGGTSTVSPNRPKLRSVVGTRVRAAGTGRSGADPRKDKTGHGAARRAGRDGGGGPRQPPRSRRAGPGKARVRIRQQVGVRGRRGRGDGGPSGEAFVGSSGTAPGRARKD